MILRTAVFTALLSLLVVGTATAQVAPNGSCNGRFQTGSFVSAGAISHGGSHLAGETTSFSVSVMLDMLRLGSKPESSQTVRPIKMSRIGLSIVASGPGVMTTICENEGCNGASFTAPVDGDFRFTVSVFPDKGSRVEVSSQCTALTTGPDEDEGMGAAAPETEEKPAPVVEEEEEEKEEEETAAEIERRTGQIASNVNGFQNNISAGRMPIMPNTSGGITPIGLGSNSQQGIELGLSNSGRKSQLDGGSGGATGLSVFTNVRFTQLTGTGDTDIEGPILEGRLGAKQEFAGGLAIGAYLSLLSADIESTPLATEVEENRYGGAVFVQMQIDDDLSAALTGFYEVGSADIVSLGASGSADTSRFALTASLQGDFDLAPVVVQPRAELGFFSESRDSYVDSAGATIAGRDETNVLGSLALRVGYPVMLNEGFVISLTPFADAAMQYYGGSDEDLVTTTGTRISDSALSGSIEAGVQMELAGGGMFVAQGGMVGIGRQSTGFS
ncbi:MAG: autotransporter outer membrane beta-barrel domain-containing protein, partial [Pseudomonadota bacterium]